MATDIEESCPSSDPVIFINPVGGAPKPARPWYAKSCFALPAMYLAVIAALWLTALVILPAVELPITGMLAFILACGPVGLIALMLDQAFFGGAATMLQPGLFLAAACAGNCFLLYRFGRLLS